MQSVSMVLMCYLLSCRLHQCIYNIRDSCSSWAFNVHPPITHHPPMPDLCLDTQPILSAVLYLYLHPYLYLYL
jgi:hypothetical protein